MHGKKIEKFAKAAIEIDISKLLPIQKIKLID